MTDVSRTRTQEGPRRVKEAAGPHLFLVLDCAEPLAGSVRYDLAGIDAVVVGRGRARTHGTSQTDGVRCLAITVPDLWMSSSHARLSLALGQWVLEDTKSKNGTLVNGHPEKKAVLRDGDLVELGRTFFLFRDHLLRIPGNPAVKDSATLDGTAIGIATLVPTLDEQMATLARIAASPVSVLIWGESGTGKELAARAIHALSGRSGPLVAVNCGAIARNLVESELFGHKKGAFSGATEDRPGLVRAADGGTLFLDEIGDLPPSAQPALLRVIQENEVLPVGGTQAVPVDIRLVAATHRQLSAMVAEGTFRQDLLARISGFTLTLPPLRERKEDLGLLTATLLRRDAVRRRERVTFAPEAVRAMLQHRWPLNIRELENALGAATALAGGGEVYLRHLPPGLGVEPSTPGKTGLRRLSPEDERVRAQLLDALEAHHGNVSAAARAIGKARAQVQRWIKRFGVDVSRFRQN